MVESGGPLLIAVSSRALFSLEAENEVFDRDDDTEYMQLQYSKLDDPASPGIAFRLVQKLLRLNDQSTKRVEVVLLSRNDPISGLRIFNSCKSHKLSIERGIFTRGRSPFGYARSFGAKLFLSAEPSDVRGALAFGVPAAQIRPRPFTGEDSHPDEIRIAFDGDGVLFSDQAEAVYQSSNLDGFHSHEVARASEPLPRGPFQPLLEAIHQLKAMQSKSSPMRIRIGLFTARSAPAHERAIRTLMNWDIRLDEVAFLGSATKAPFLQDFDPEFFFDDSLRHITPAADLMAAGHVPYGVNNPVPVAE